MMQEKQSLAKYYIASISAAVIWAFMVIPIRQLHGYDPFFMLLSRIMLATILIYAYVFLFNKKALTKDIDLFKNNVIGTKQKVIGLIVLSGLCLAINWFTYIYLIVKINIVAASLVYVLVPLIMAIGSFIVYKDKLDKYKILSLMMAFVVIIFLSYEHLQTILYVLFCASSYAIFMLLQKQLPHFHRLNLFAYEVLIIFIISLPIFLFQLQDSGVGLDFFYWSRLLVIAICFTILPMFLNLYGLSKISGSSVAMIIYLNPIASFLLGMIFFDEQLRYQELFLYATLFMSVIIFNINNIKEMLLQKNTQQ